MRIYERGGKLRKNTSFNKREDFGERIDNYQHLFIIVGAKTA